MRTAIILLAFASQAFAIDHYMLDVDALATRPPAEKPTDSPPADVPRPAVVVPKLQRLPTGYLWTFSDAQQFKESFAQYAVRTGKRPPEAQPQCSTGYCGTFSRYPTIATGGCKCGCNASTCSCHHSPNAGKPLPDQRYEPGRLAGRTR